MIWTEELMIRPPEPAGNYTSSHLVANQEEVAKEMLNFTLRSMSFIFHTIL
jgi:hypothetical protein